MTQEQLDVLNITQEVLRATVLALCATNPEAMPRVGHALCAASLADRLSPMSQSMLGDLATGVEMLSGRGACGH